MLKDSEPLEPVAAMPVEIDTVPLAPDCPSALLMSTDPVVRPWPVVTLTEPPLLVPLLPAMT